MHARALLFLCLSAWFAIGKANAVPVFPEAKGFGTETAAGSGRHLDVPRSHVYRVTSLDDGGSGSLRECVEATHPRTCIFEISGTIHLLTPLDIVYPYITVAGQTAPFPGILLRGAGLIVSTHDVLVQHLQVRPGGESSGPNPVSRDGVAIGGEAFGVVIDHLSISWATDENVSTYGPVARRITVSNCIIADALDRSIHPKGPHSKGMLIGDLTKELTVHNNLFAHNVERNPYVKPGSSVEFLGNVVYHWGGRSGSNLANISDEANTGLPVLLDFVGNIYIPSAVSPLLPLVNAKRIAAGTRLYVSGNIGVVEEPSDGSCGGDQICDGGWLVAEFPESPFRSSVPLLDSPGRFDLEEVLPRVLRRAGSRPAERNEIDARLIADVRERQGDFKDCVAGCDRDAGGWPIVPVNRRPLHLPSHPDADDNRNGYTNLEEWIAGMAEEVEG